MPVPQTEAELVVDLDGFEGPISLLLLLARDQKVDLKRISILALAEQYLSFIRNADRMRLELAADYLVMAAWLAYLKSRLLMPDPQPDDDDAPSGAELAAALAFQLQRLAAMQDAAKLLFKRPLLGRDTFNRPSLTDDFLPAQITYQVSLYEMLKVYANQQSQGEAQILHIRAPEYYAVEDALQRLGQMIGIAVEWRSLEMFLPSQMIRGALGRSAVATTFAASLELAKDGRIELRQDDAFGPIWLRVTRPDV